MQKQEVDSKAMIYTGLWVAVVTVVTMAVAIPIPLTQGYVNLGDAAVFLGAFLLGRKYGTAAAGIGSAFADLLLSYVAFAPFTLVIKAGMAFIFATFLKFSEGKIRPDGPKIPAKHFVGIAVATVWMAGGYYAAEWFITGNRMVPIVSIPWNLLQGLLGGAIALGLMTVMQSLRLPWQKTDRKKAPFDTTGWSKEEQPPVYGGPQDEMHGMLQDDISATPQDEVHGMPQGDAAEDRLDDESAVDAEHLPGDE